MQTTLAPILLFTYKRLDTLKQTVVALRNNELASQSNLYIFSDAAKTLEDAEVVNSVRSYIRTIDGFNNIHIYESETNQGLANSIIRGVSKIISKYGKVIVLEDDLVTTSNFLTFMNSSLEYYETNKIVYSISGYNYNFEADTLNEFDNYFATRGCSWGWATWFDRWNSVDWDINNYTSINSPDFKKSFNDSGSDLTSMLRKQKLGNIDSWAIRWYYNQWKVNGLTCYPTFSLVDNQGFDQNATHTQVFNRYKTNLMSESKKSFYLNPEISLNSHYQKLIQSKFSILTRIFWGRGMTILMKMGLTR